MSYYRVLNRRVYSLSDWPTMLVTFAVCVFCWCIAFIYSVGFPIGESVMKSSLWNYLDGLFVNKIVAYSLGLFLMAFVAFVMQRISDIEMLIRERTQLPIMLFVLLFSTNAGLLPIKEVSVVLFFMIFMIYELFKSYQQPEATGTIFNAAVCISMASLFLPQMIWFLPLLWLGMYLFRSISLKSFLASLVGFLIIYWFVLGWCVWKHDYSIFVSIFSELIDFEFFSLDTLFQYYQIGTIGVVLLLLPAFFHTKMDALNNSVRVRYMLSFLLNMAIWSLVLLFLYGKDSDSFLAILYLSSSILIAYFFENMRHKFRFSLYYFMLILWLVSFLIRVWTF